MTSVDYGEGYWEHGEGSNYVRYGDDPGWRRTAEVIRDSQAPGLLYELGSAKGWFLSACLTVGIDARGIDISEWAVGHRAPGLDGRLVLGNAVELPWPDQSADAVCSWEFLEHVYEDELDRVLHEIDRVLRPGGIMWHRIGIDMDGDPSHQQHDHTHYNERPREYWEQLFSDRGYEHCPELQGSLRWTHRDRDWMERFFVWQKAL